MRSKKYLKLFILMIGIIFIGTNVVKADVQINTSGNDYTEINARNYFNNCPLNIIKKVDTNGNVVFCADHDMPLPFGGNGIYTWTRSGTSAQSSAVAYIFENADTSTDVGYLIAQFAVWYFVDNETFSRYFNYQTRSYTYSSGGDNTKANTAKIMDLIDGALNASSGNSINVTVTAADKSLSLTSDGKYYISKPITLSASADSAVSMNRTGTAVLQGTNIPTGAFVTTDASATSGKNSIEVSTSKDVVVYIKVPVSSITTTTNVTLTYLVNGEISGASYYETSSTWEGKKIQDLVVYDPQSTFDRKSVAFTINFVKKNKVTVSKKSITGTSEIPGATLVIKDSKGATISSWVTKNTTTSVELAAGTYTLEETKAPAGYILNKNKVTFVVSDDGKVKVNNKEVTVVEIKNTPIIVNISKRSINGKSELPGAKLTIKDKDGKVAKDVNGKELTWTSTTEAVKFQLVPGTYFLSEEVAPKGYELSETVTKFVVGEDGTVKSDNKNVDNNLIVYTNTPSPEEVKTGSFLIYIIVIGTLSAGAATYFALKHNRETV